MGQLTLEQAAKEYSSSGYYRDREETFKAGAKWQKEQYKKLIELAKLAANICEDEGAMVTAVDLREELERLQD